MSDAAVAVANLSKVYPVPFQRRAIVAVRDLNLTVPRGQIYGLLGPNGSGKSTTMKIILGLASPTKGRTEIFGCDSRQVESRQRVGFLPESPYFPKYLSATEMLAFYGKLSGLRARSLRARVSEMLEAVGLTDARDRRIGTFSKGMLQRVGLAQAMISDPELLVLDEPTAGVDPAGALQIREIVLGLKRRGKTVLLSSHLLSQVQEICDRVSILANGVLVREGALNELLMLHDQMEIVIESASPELVRELAESAERKGARVIETRRARTSLEQLFLDATQRK